MRGRRERSTTYKKVGELIKDTRISLNMTQEEVANLAGTSKQNLSAIEHGAPPLGPTMLKLIYVLGLDYYDVLNAATEDAESMKLRTCDVCGKTYHIFKGYMPGRLSFGRKDGNRTRMCNKNICDDCLAKLESWVENAGSEI